jgi:DNA-directed RNA polymerase subunit omega
VIYPKIDDLLEQVDSKYALAIAAAKRARQINDYHHQLGEGSFEQFPPPLVESRSKNFLTMALEEIAQRKLVTSYPSRERLRERQAQQLEG